MGYKFIPKQLLGSVYTISELKDNFDNIKIGDEVNYEINGYSDWQVIGKNEFDGTIDVVSKTNTEDLTLEPNQTKEYYENKFQETANKYIDNSYAISARTVNSSDLDYFEYDNDFWLNNISDLNIKTANSLWQYDQSNVEPNHKMYVIPYVEVYFENYNEYNVGDIIEYSNNGVNRWVVAGKEVWNSSSLILIPETPIELVIESLDDNISEKANQIIYSFNIDVSDYGNYVSAFGTDNLPNLTPNFLNQQTERIYFFNYACYNKNNNSLSFGCGGLPYYENGEFNRLFDIFYTDTNPYTLGYRPVVTLKVKEAKEGKDLSSKIKVGDNVKYEAKGYKNWKVLSVDNDLNTVDIISGGIVKNIALSGKEDWDNYEDIIQREVDQYKNGEQAKKATTITSKDLKTLKEIDKSILSEYLLLSKNSYIKGNDGYSIKYYYYCISTYSQFKIKNDEIHLNIIPIFADLKGDQEEVDRYKNSIYITNVNSSSYTAGLRPVITIKLSDIEKLSEKETKEIEKSTAKQEKIYIKEQETKNKNYKGPKTVDDTSSKGTKKDEKDNNTNIIDNDNNNESKVIEKVVYKDKKTTKVILYISLIFNFIAIGVITCLVLKIKSLIKK